VVGSDQVAVRFYPPPGKPPGLQQLDEGSCTRAASGYVKLYVECMEARGYQPEIVGQGGIHKTVADLPEPPRRPTPVAMAPPVSSFQRPPAAPLSLGGVTGTTWHCPDGEDVIIDASGNAVEMVMQSPPCRMLIVNGVVGRMQNDGCPFLIDIYNVRQSVSVRGNIVEWSFVDAGNGLLTALNVGTGGGTATLNTRPGVLESSMGDTGRCHK
jgi:hypothetical protein